MSAFGAPGIPSPHVGGGLSASRSITGLGVPHLRSVTCAVRTKQTSERNGLSKPNVDVPPEYEAFSTSIRSSNSELLAPFEMTY